MMIWLIFTAMLGIAVFVVARPFLRRSDMADGGQSQDVSLFKEQLAELDADIARGAVTQQEAAGSRREIELRLLAVIKQGKDSEMTDTGEGSRMLAMAIVLGWVVVGSIGLFVVLREPQPMPRIVANMPAPAPQLPATPVAQQTPETQPIGTVDAMITQLAARLEQNSDDYDGWRMLGWSHLRTGNAVAAAEAFRRALDLNSDDAELHALYAETLVRIDGGRVSETALASIDASLSRNPDNPRAGFFKGMALDQAGDTAAALTLWLSILERTPENADYRQGLVQRIQEKAAAVGFDLSGYPALASDLGGGLRLPTEEEIAAAQDMSSEDRGAMIRGMVEGLADRLADDPNDADGWVRLIRSYGVLGEPQKALEALQSAEKAFPKGTPARALIDEAGQGLRGQ